MSEDNPTEKITPVAQNRFDTMYGRLDDRVSELEDENKKLWDIVEEQSETIEVLQGRLERAASSKVDKMCDMIDAADNKRDASQEEVSLLSGEIVVATGTSDRHSYNLMDYLAEMPFATVHEKEEIEGRPNKPKRVVISFDGREPERLKALVRKSSRGEGE